ncbi:MAG: hypothetical protein AAFQ35_07165 [Pseudomonadota bacterium]
MTNDTMDDVDFKPTSLDDMVEDLDAPDAAQQVTGDTPVEPADGTPPAPEQTVATPEEDTSPDIVGMRQALTAERHKRQAYEQQIAEMEHQLASQQQSHESDAAREFEDLAFHDPAAAIQQQVEAMRQEMQGALLQQAAAQSEAMMRSTHADYDEVTTPLYEIAAAHPTHPVVQQILASPNPAQTAYETAKNLLRVAEMQQPDYREKLKEEVRRELQGQPAQGAPQAAPSLAPTSLASIPSANVGQRPAFQGPTSLDSILDG